jgi:hypothetical protein
MVLGMVNCVLLKIQVVSMTVFMQRLSCLFHLNQNLTDWEEETGKSARRAEDLNAHFL